MTFFSSVPKKWSPIMVLLLLGSISGCKLLVNSKSADATDSSTSTSTSTSDNSTITISYSNPSVILSKGIAISTINLAQAVSGNVSFSISPALPAGLSLSQSGAISGTPTQESAKTTYTIKATRSNGKSASTLLVLSVVDFGNGSTGTYTVPGANTVVNTYTYLTQASIAAAATSFTVNSNTGFSVGDQVLIIQMQNASGILKREFTTISAISGTTITVSSGLQNSYTSGTFDQANASVTQMIRVPQYVDLTIPVGTSITANAWNGYTGGIAVFKVSGTLTVAGSINVNAKGYRQGASVGYAAGVQTWQGESWRGKGAQANGQNNGAGGGSWNSNQCSFSNGGAAGHGTAGAAGFAAYAASVSIPGAGGSVIGSTDLTNLYLGPGGGGDDHNCGGPAGSAGAGGGSVIIAAKNITVTGSISANGASGTQAGGGNVGGGGAGGSIYLIGNALSIGSNLVTATGGIAPGALGGAGRIRFDSNLITGTSSPAAGYVGEL